MPAVPPPSGDDERVRPQRLVVVALFVAIVLLGLFFYFRHGAEMAPVLGAATSALRA